MNDDIKLLQSFLFTVRSLNINNTNLRSEMNNFECPFYLVGGVVVLG